MFAVATFTATGEVDAVPVSWLRDCEGVCCWPPYKTYARLTKAKTSGETPTAEWSSHSVRCLYKTGEFFLRLWVVTRKDSCLLFLSDIGSYHNLYCNSYYWRSLKSTIKMPLICLTFFCIKWHRYYTSQQPEDVLGPDSQTIIR